jgi:plasmid maintenance system antidote protein VapI
MPKTAQTPGTVLIAQMDEYQLNPFALSKAINLSQSAVRQIVLGKTKISVPTALRLSKFFSQKPE